MKLWAEIGLSPRSGWKTWVKRTEAMVVEEVLSRYLSNDLIDHIICLVFADDWIGLSDPNPAKYDNEITYWLDYWLMNPREQLANPFKGEVLSFNCYENASNHCIIHNGTLLCIQFPSNYLPPEGYFRIIGDNIESKPFIFDDTYDLGANTFYHPWGSIPCRELHHSGVWWENLNSNQLPEWIKFWIIKEPKSNINQQIAKWWI